MASEKTTKTKKDLLEEHLFQLGLASDLAIQPER